MKNKPSKSRQGRSDGALALRFFDSQFGSTWDAWRAWLCSVFGLPMTDDEAALFRRFVRSEEHTSELQSQ